MRLPKLILLSGLFCLFATPLFAQQTQTPPVAPKVQETPLPATIDVPPPMTLPAEVPNRPLTVDEAVRIALHKQPAIAAAAAGIAASQGRTQQARSGLQPSVGVGAAANYVNQFAVAPGVSPTNANGSSAGLTPGYAASVGLRQLLFDFNHTRDLVRQASALERAANANLTRTQSDLVFQVKQAYYTTVQNNRLVAVNEGNVHNRQAQTDLAEARLRSGLGLPIDVVRAKTALSEAILNLTLARSNASISRVALAATLGVDPRTPVLVEDAGEPALTTDDVQGLVSTGLKQRPEMLQALATLQAANHGVRVAKTTNAPTITANVTVGTRDTSFPPGNDGYSIGASIQWTPFDGGFTAGRVREARANVDAAQAQLDNTQLVVISDISESYINLRTSEQRVVTADAEVANAQESVRLAEGRYRSGVGTFLDLLDAQTSLLTARTNRVNAQSSVDQARAAVARAVGAPIPSVPPPALAPKAK